MTFKPIKKTIRALLGAPAKPGRKQAALAEIKALRADVSDLKRMLAKHADATADPGVEVALEVTPKTDLELLPGTVYGRYALPLDYPPSRRLAPRWGVSHPPIPEILAWLSRDVTGYETILAAMTANRPHLAKVPRDYIEANLPMPAWRGVPFSPFDGAALFTIIGQFRPRRYVEIGSGITTCWSHHASRTLGLDMEITSVDPDPRAAIDGICDTVIRAGLETCDLAIFDQLEPNDILFFDGSHRVFMNSDVTVFMIDILPRLKPGVIVHVHDITLPWDYPDMFIPWYWSEQYILATYIMAGADRLTPIFPTAYVCRDPAFDHWFRQPLVALGDHDQDWRGGGSMWFTKRAPLA